MSSNGLYGRVEFDFEKLQDSSGRSFCKPCKCALTLGSDSRTVEYNLYKHINGRRHKINKLSWLTHADLEQEENTGSRFDWEDDLNPILLKKNGIFIKNNIVYCNFCECYLPQLSNDKNANVNNIKIHVTGREHISCERMGHRNDSPDMSNMPDPSIGSEKLNWFFKELPQQLQFNRKYIISINDNAFECVLCNSCYSLGCKESLIDHLNWRDHLERLPVEKVCTFNQWGHESNSIQFDKNIDEPIYIDRDSLNDFSNVVTPNNNNREEPACSSNVSSAINNGIKPHSYVLRVIGSHESPSASSKESFVDYNFGKNYQYNNSRVVTTKNSDLKLLPASSKNISSLRARRIDLISDTFSFFIPKYLHSNKRFILLKLNELSCSACNCKLVTDNNLSPLSLCRVLVIHLNSNVHLKSLDRFLEPTLGEEFSYRNRRYYCKSSVIMKILFDSSFSIVYFNINDFVEFTCDDDKDHRIVKCSPCKVLFEVDMKTFNNTHAIYDHIRLQSHMDTSSKFNSRKDSLKHVEISDYPYYNDRPTDTSSSDCTDSDTNEEIHESYRTDRVVASSPPYMPYSNESALPRPCQPKMHIPVDLFWRL